MSAKIDLGPPGRGTNSGGGDRWVELIALPRRHEADEAMDRLGGSSIETRLVTVPRSASRTTFIVFVRRLDLQDSLFLIAILAFERPSARPRRLSLRLAGIVMAGLLSLTVALAGVTQPRPPGAPSCERGNLGGASFRGLIVPCRAPRSAP